MEEDEYIDEEDEEEDFDDEDEEEGIGLFETPVLDKVSENPNLILKNPQMEKGYEASTQIRKHFENKDSEEDKPRVHPGFVSSYSFGEHEFERLKFMLIRLDEVSEKVLTYRKENMGYFPEFYSILKNFFTVIKFIIDSTNREKISQGFDYVKQAVIRYTTQKEMDMIAVEILEEIYSKLTDIKNFHGLGFSYEKKKGESEKYGEAFFKRKPR